MADNVDSLGNWTGTQADSGLDVPESRKVSPGSLTAEDQENQLRGSVPAGPTTRVKDNDDDMEGLRNTSHTDSNVPATAAGEKVTAEGKKADSDEDAAPLAAPATSEAPAEDVKDGGTTKVHGRKAAEPRSRKAAEDK